MYRFVSQNSFSYLCICIFIFVFAYLMLRICICVFVFAYLCLYICGFVFCSAFCLLCQIAYNSNNVNINCVGMEYEMVGSVLGVTVGTRITNANVRRTVHPMFLQCPYNVHKCSSLREAFLYRVSLKKGNIAIFA